jgi:hypothetical protein
MIRQRLNNLFRGSNYKLKDIVVDYSNGNEYVYRQKAGREPVEYIGYYYKTKNGNVYVGNNPSATPRIPLSTAPKSFFESENKRYFILTGNAFDRYSYPQYHFPSPTNANYKKGVFTRYFVKKKNEDTIIEISREAAAKYNNSNLEGTNSYLWKKMQLKWTISGPIEDVRKVNQRVLEIKEQEMPGILNYLSDLDEFHEQRPILNLQKQSRTYSDGEVIHPNLPVAYGYPAKEGQNCSNCAFYKNHACTLWQANVRHNFWCGRWKKLNY